MIVSANPQTKLVLSQCSQYAERKDRIRQHYPDMVDKLRSSPQTHFWLVFGDEAVSIGHFTLE